MRILPFLATSLFTALAAAQITPGNLVVLRVGDGVAPLSGSAQAMFLDEFTPTGTLVQSLAMPTVASGANQPITCSGTSTSEANLQLDENGQFLTFGGYAAAPGTASIAATLSATTPRVVGMVTMNGTIDTSTTISNAFSAGNIRSVVTNNGVDFFAAGSNSGVQYATLGATTATTLTTGNPLNNRVVSVYNGQLYVSGSAQTFFGVSTVGTGVSTLPGQTITALPGMPTAAGPSYYDFFFADPNTLYVADDRASLSAGGIYKYTLVAGTWTLQYTLNPAATTGCRGLTGVNNGGIVTLYATSTLGSTNVLFEVLDLGATSTFNPIATAPTNTVFRGVRYIAGSPFVSRIRHGCGPTSFTSVGDASIGTTFTSTVGNTTGIPFVGYGFAVFPAPVCATCTLGHEWAVVLFGANSVFGIPNNSAFVGVTIGIQGADLLGSGGCASPGPVTLTDTLVITLH